MVFPADPLPIRAEMEIGGVWTEVTNRVRLADDIVITGGSAPTQSGIQPGTIAFTLNNRNGDFTDDNPLSPYYGQLPINTPFRVGVEGSETFALLAPSIDYDPAASSAWQAPYISTSDKASLDVTGDLDLRIEIEPRTWNLGSAGHTLAAKWENASGAQRSWFWTILPSGRMRLYWSTDGTFSGIYADSTASVPTGARIALRVTIDVNNGAAGRTLTFYTASSITGSWTQLGSTVVQSGTTSIFSSSANMHVGAFRNTALSFPFTDGSNAVSLPLSGRIYRFQMYNGIAGTLVADMNATAQAEGTTSWSDGLAAPNTWDLINGAEITVVDRRGIAEVSDMPQDWDITGTDVFIRTVASDIVRRRTQGATPLRSPIYRNLRQLIGNGALSYLTLEGGSQTTAAGNAVPGQPAGTVSNVLFTTDTDFPATAGIMTLNDTNASIGMRVVGAPAADQIFLIFYYKLPAAPGTDIEVFNLYTSGTLRRVAFTIGAATYRVTAYDYAGASLGSNFSAFGSGAAPGQWLALQIVLAKNGTGVDVDLGWYTLGKGVFYGLTTMTIGSATVGVPVRASTTAAAAAANMSFAHIMIGNKAGFDFANVAFASASDAFVGENAAARWMRLLREEGERGVVIGWPGDTAAMGPQPSDTLMAVLDECARTAGALHYGSRDFLGLEFRTQRSMVMQSAQASLDYAQNHLSGSFKPTNDDQLLRNNVTANARTGSFAVATKETGRKSVQPPPDGAGPYDASVNVNPAADEQLPDLAGYEVFQGTWPDRRVPNLEVWLERRCFTTSATLTAAMRAVGPGDRVTVANVPVWVGGGSSDTLARGYQETLQNRGHRIALSTVPYGPFGALNDLGATSPLRRAGASNTSLAVAMASGDTTAVALTPTGKLWGTTAGKPGNFPLDVVLGGERVTVSGIAAWVADDFGRTSSSSWGSTSTGSKAWTTSGGSASDYNVTSNLGRMNLSTVTTARTAALSLSARVSEVRLDKILMNSALTGVGATATVSVLIGSSTDYIGLNIQMITAGTATFWLNQVVGGVETTFNGFPSTGLSATASMSARVAILSDGDGTYTAYARIWATGGVEPGTWPVVMPMTKKNAVGGLTLVAFRNSSSTNAAPFNIDFDGLTLPTLQVFSLSARAVNGVAKAQSVDTDMQVADSFYAARS